MATRLAARVERELRGSVPDEQEVIVETLGGQVGDIAMRVEGEPQHREQAIESPDRSGSKSETNLVAKCLPDAPTRRAFYAGCSLEAPEVD